MDAGRPRLGPPVAVTPGALNQEQAMTEDLDSSNLQDTLDLYKDALQEAGHAEGARGWLSSSLQTTKGTDQLYGLLQHYVQKPAFLQKLANARASATTAEAPDPAPPARSEAVHLEADVTQATFWESAPVGSVDEVIEGLVEEEALGSYVLVEKEDVLDAVSTFIAAYLATIPEAQHMKPTDLQQALTSTFQDLRKGNVRRFWEWGRCAYRCIAFSYGAFSVYENPWLVRAVVTALWAAGKVMLGLLL